MCQERLFPNKLQLFDVYLPIFTKDGDTVSLLAISIICKEFSKEFSTSKSKIWCYQNPTSVVSKNITQSTFFQRKQRSDKKPSIKIIKRKDYPIEANIPKNYGQGFVLWMGWNQIWSSWRNHRRTVIFRYFLNHAFQIFTDSNLSNYANEFNF